MRGFANSLRRLLPARQLKFADGFAHGIMRFGEAEPFQPVGPALGQIAERFTRPGLPVNLGWGQFWSRLTVVAPSLASGPSPFF